MTLALLLLSCGSAPPTAPAVTFVRGGLVVASGEGRLLADGRVLREHDWRPGERVGDAVAPLQPECLPLFEVELGDLTGAVARGISAPDTALAFSPDGERLAVATYLGEVRILDAWTGEELARRVLAETLVRRLIYAADGRTLYAGEQSVDAWLHALDPEDLSTRARLRLADQVQSSAPPAGDDLYGVYTLPGVYGLEEVEGGDLLVLAAHGWNGPDGQRRNQSRLLRVRHAGAHFEVQAGFPADGAADATFLSMAVGDGRVAISVHRSAAGEAPEGLAVGGVQVLEAATLGPVAAVRPSPLQPWFDRAFVWESIALGSWGIALGLGDGRVWRADGAGAPVRVHPLGVPIAVGEVPISASIGHLVEVDGALWTLTSGTSIPYGAAAPELHPPEPHPLENTVFVLDPSGAEPLWSWSGPHALHGLVAGEHTVVVGAGPRPGTQRSDHHGVLVFDTVGPSLTTFCEAGGPVFWRQAVHGRRVAVASFPEKDGASVRGAYAVTVFR